MQQGLRVRKGSSFLRYSRGPLQAEAGDEPRFDARNSWIT